MMSADSCRSSSNSSLRTEVPKGSLIRPQPVTESSLLDSVAGFINEVQALNKPNHDSKIQITWASFQRADINDPGLFSELAEINGNYPPLLLTLGYTQGVQVWIIPMTGEAQEVLAWRQGQVKTLKILPSPENCFGSPPDNFAHCRPLVVLVDSTGPGSAFTSASFISLKSGEVVHNIKFNSEVADVLANRRVVLMTFREKLAAFDACNLEPKFTVTTCYPSPGVHVNPIALGERWLAYADQQFVAIHRSCGGMIVDGGQSVTAWGINVGSKLAQGVSKLYSNIFSTKPSTMSSCHPSLPPTTPTSGPSSSGSGNEMQKGIVTILDVLEICNSADQDEVNLHDKMAGVIAHFVAHNKAVVAMEFDSNGTLLLTADSVGNYFNLFKIMAHPSGSCYSTVHHLYSLYRGETPGSVQDIAFSPDSRWVAVSTLRGTTHIFPTTPYGGQIGVRTHTSTRVVNKLSRFHRSAGLDEYPTTSNSASSGRSSPNPSLGSSPVISKMYVDPSMTGNCPLVIPYPNPYVPPFPAPTLSQPLAQLRQPYIVTLATNAKSSTKKHSEELIPIRLAVAFAPSRASAKQTGNIFHRQGKSKMAESLFVMASHGVLLEYTLEAMPDVNSKDNICESSPIKLQVEAFGQWNLTAPKATNDLQPPLSLGNPLMDSVLFGNDRSLARHPSGGEDRWLSQVEIVTHVGPHRRLWMGPQFCFKTLKPAKDGDSVVTQDLDITCRPEQSNPVNMPTSGYLTNQHNVLIECGSASSFELSPRFANHPFRERLSSQEQVHQDLENEIQEAMSETIHGEENLDGLIKTHQLRQQAKYHQQQQQSKKTKTKLAESSSAEEEFFCLTPEDARSISSNTSERSRNASTASGHQIPDSKIFSVAVEAKTKDQPGSASGLNSMMVCDVDTDYTGRFAVVSSSENKRQGSSKKRNKVVVKQVSTEFKIEGNDALDQMVASFPEDSCEKLLAEALETTVLDDPKEATDVKVISPPKILENADDEDDKFEEMSKNVKADEDEEIFTEMKKPENSKFDEDDEDEEIGFKIKENHGDEDEEESVTNMNKLVDVDSTATSTAKIMTKSVDLLGNDIVKSIEKANLMYENSDDLGQLFKTNNDQSSEDDLEFKPVTSGKKKRKKNKSQSTNSTSELASSYADSESSDVHMDVQATPASATSNKTEGWSFEADDLDVNKLLSEANLYNNNNPSELLEQDAANEEEEEKAALEDVFKFDSEIGAEENDPDDDNMEPALADPQAEQASKNENMSTSLSDLSENKTSSANGNLSQSMTFGIGCSTTGTSNSESSVGNSPNPRAASKKKGKSKKKKR